MPSDVAVAPRTTRSGADAPAAASTSPSGTTETAQRDERAASIAGASGVVAAINAIGRVRDGAAGMPAPAVASRDTAGG